MKVFTFLLLAIICGACNARRLEEDLWEAVPKVNVDINRRGGHLRKERSIDVDVDALNEEGAKSMLKYMLKQMNMNVADFVIHRMDENEVKDVLKLIENASKSNIEYSELKEQMLGKLDITDGTTVEGVFNDNEKEKLRTLIENEFENEHSGGLVSQDDPIARLHQGLADKAFAEIMKHSEDSDDFFVFLGLLLPIVREKNPDIDSVEKLVAKFLAKAGPEDIDDDRVEAILSDIIGVERLSTARLELNSDMDGECTRTYCTKKLDNCLFDKKCKVVMECLKGCYNVTISEQRLSCHFSCGFYEDKKYKELMQCRANHDCLSANPPTSGICIKGNGEGNNLEKVGPETMNGKWSVIWGLNCNQDISLWGANDIQCNMIIFSGGTDSFSMTNSYCFGNPKSGDCSTSIYSWAKYGRQQKSDLAFDLWTMNGPAVVGPVTTWLEVLDYPNDDYMMVSTCEASPLMKVNNVAILARGEKSDSDMPEPVRKAFKKTADMLGFKIEDRCVKTNTNCPN